MRMEHVALNVADVKATAKWYVDNLEMNIVSAGEIPAHATFLADSAGLSMLELYTHADPLPPQWRERDRVQLHVAFLTTDMEKDRNRLLKAGALADGEPVHTPAGDILLFFRDPWGLAFQLVQRASPLLKE